MASKGKNHKPASPQSKATADAIALRRKRIAELRLKRMTLQDIAAEVGVSTSTVFWDVKELIAQAEISIKHNAEIIRQQELEKLDAIESVQIDRALADNQLSGAAVDRIVRTSERRAKLLGLDAPTRIETSVRQAITGEVLDLFTDAANRALQTAYPEAHAALMAEFNRTLEEADGK